MGQVGHLQVRPELTKSEILWERGPDNLVHACFDDKGKTPFLCDQPGRKQGKHRFTTQWDVHPTLARKHKGTCPKCVALYEGYLIESGREAG